MRRRRAWAAGLWLVLAFLVWNVRFDYGVRTAASAYINARALYLRGTGPRVEMSAAMRAGVQASARAATLVASPALLVSLCLVAFPPLSRRSTRAGG